MWWVTGAASLPLCILTFILNKNKWVAHVKNFLLTLTRILMYRRFVLIIPTASPALALVFTARWRLEENGAVEVRAQCELRYTIEIINKKDRWDSGKPRCQKILFFDIRIKVVISHRQIYVYHTNLLPLKI